MKKLIAVGIMLLLLINGTGALFGGFSLIMHPDGSGIKLSPHWLEHTPFHDYLIPGIILFTCNGLFSVFVLVMLLWKYKHASWLVMAQGAILTGWIIIQIFMIVTFHTMHLIMGTIGLALMGLGWVHRQKIPA